ncbi:MAG: hypothetical protein FJ280_18745, partial [Planctomycetes bacterium]|nr:hypothetical protein [Planctomycetota bacterium]
MNVGEGPCSSMFLQEQDIARPDSKSARMIAAQVLRDLDPAREYAGPLLDRLLSQTEERQRATDLVYGTLRNLDALDAVITQFSGRPTSRIAPALLSILRIGVYELAYHPATPVYSIVNEAVSNVEATAGKKQTGFVNAVLRQVARHIVGRQIDLTQASPRQTLIQTPQTGCQFDTDFLPDPAASLQMYLSTCFSLPPWLVGEWIAEFGPDWTCQICLACNRRPSLYIRVNPLRTTAGELLNRFEQAGVQAEPAVLSDDSRHLRSMGILPMSGFPNAMNRVWGPSSTGVPPVEAGPQGPHDKGAALPCPDLPSRAPNGLAALDFYAPEMIRIAGPHAVTQLPGFAEGLFTVQDLSASQAVRLLNPQPGWSILDLCAAPGTKTTQLAEATRDAARIIATDINPERLDRVQENLTRLGLRSITIVPYAQLQPGQTGPFDVILLDAPCSNTGVLARRVEARFRLRRKAIQEIA